MTHKRPGTILAAEAKTLRHVAASRWHVWGWRGPVNVQRGRLVRNRSKGFQMEASTPPEKSTQHQTQPASPEPAESIGPLVFVPHPEYPYPFNVEQPPRFWMEETTGALHDAVDTYMSGEQLSSEQLDLIKIYLRQYIERAVLAGDANRKQLLQKVDRLRTTADVEAFADELSEYGAEVF